MKIFLLFLWLLLSFDPYNANATQKSDSVAKKDIYNTANKENSFAFVVWGHPRGATDGSHPLYFDEILNRITKLDPDFLVITGDIVSGGASRSKPLNPELILSDWKYFDDNLEKLDIPVFRTPGNHDVNNFTTRDIYLKRYRKPPYAITFNGSRLIFLDSVGIDQRKNDSGRYWYFLGLPFDESQIDFIKKEIAGQNIYEHVFFFWHHTRFWSDPNSLWWKDVHPLIKNGKTRAVFTGDPEEKYLYENHDGIHYIASAIFETPDIKWFKKHQEAKSGWDTFKQLDNIQYVTVNKSDVTIQPIIVGSKDNKGLSPRYWRKIKSSFTWRQRFIHDFTNSLTRFRHLVIIAALWAGVWMVVGILISVYWCYRKRNRITRS